MKNNFLFQTNFLTQNYLKLPTVVVLFKIVPGDVGGRLPPPPPLRSEERERFIPPDGFGSVRE